MSRVPAGRRARRLGMSSLGAASHLVVKVLEDDVDPRDALPCREPADDLLLGVDPLVQIHQGPLVQHVDRNLDAGRL